MKKALIIIALLCSMPLVFTGCKTKVDTDNNTTVFSKFTVIETRNNPNDGVLYIMYDNDTKVEYYYIYTGHRAGLCPVYNADGTIKVYTETSD